MNDSERQNFQVGDLIRRRYGAHLYRVRAIAANSTLYCVAEKQPSIQIRFVLSEQGELMKICSTEEESQ